MHEVTRDQVLNAISICNAKGGMVMQKTIMESVLNRMGSEKKIHYQDLSEEELSIIEQCDAEATRVP